jgi:hypothetical protein
MVYFVESRILFIVPSFEQKVKKWLLLMTGEFSGGLEGLPGNQLLEWLRWITFKAAGA